MLSKVYLFNSICKHSWNDLFILVKKNDADFFCLFIVYNIATYTASLWLYWGTGDVLS